MNCNSPGAEKPTRQRLHYKKQDNFFNLLFKLPYFPSPAHRLYNDSCGGGGGGKRKRKTMNYEVAIGSPIICKHDFIRSCPDGAYPS